MPLSEEELRLLDQMERALVEEDPKFASTLRGTSLRRSARRRAFAAGVTFVGGMAVLLAGAILQQTVVGIIGFVIMLASATLGLTAMRGQKNASTMPDPGAGSHPSRGFTVVNGGRTGKSRRLRRGSSSSLSNGSFVERMEERWRRRREQGGM